MKPKVIFFCRDYQARLFPYLTSTQYDSVYVTLTLREKNQMQTEGHSVYACFEEYFMAHYKTVTTSIGEPQYSLDTSFFSDRFMGHFSLDERNLFLKLAHLFWEEVFSATKPIAVVNEIIAIEISEVMYIVGRKHGASYYGWLISQIPGRQFYWLDVPYNSTLPYAVLESGQSSANIEFAKEYISRYNTAEGVKPFYVANLPGRFNLAKFAKLNISFWRAKLHQLFRSNNVHPYFHPFYYINPQDLKDKCGDTVNSLRYKYDDLIQYSSYELFFYPLHYEPEASIIYMSPYNEDQAALIRNIAKCLKPGQLLVVKEHPQQKGVLLRKKYRALRKLLSNVLMLPAEYNTRDLIRQSKGIVTQTSSAGWEGIIYQKPVIVMGNVFYDRHPGVNKVTDFVQLKEMLRTDSYKIPKEEDTVKFVAAMYNYCCSGNPYVHPSLYTEENIKYLVKAIEDRVVADEAAKTATTLI